MKKSELPLLVKLWLPPLVWAAVIFTFSSIEQIKVTDFIIGDFAIKKSAHLIEYAVLYALLFRAATRRWFWAYFITLIYALSDEFHQSFVPGRTASIFDLGFDLTGANIAGYTIWKLGQIRQKKHNK